MPKTTSYGSRSQKLQGFRPLPRRCRALPQSRRLLQKLGIPLHVERPRAFGKQKFSRKAHPLIPVIERASLQEPKTTNQVMITGRSLRMQLRTLTAIAKKA